MGIGSWDLLNLLVHKMEFAKVIVQGSKYLVGLFLGFQPLKFVNNPTREASHHLVFMWCVEMQMDFFIFLNEVLAPLIWFL